jgi:DNA-binding GntR family transcriptional regulator
VPDYADDRPVYVQIADDLRARIRDGEFPPGDKLPSGRDLADHYHAAYETVRQALEVLRDANIVVMQSTRGTFVLRTPGDQEPSAEYRDLAEQVRQLTERMSAVDAWIAAHDDQQQQ